MQKLRRAAALVGVAALLLMYIVAFATSFGRSELARTLFRAAIGCTILLPVLLYAILLATKAVTGGRSRAIDTVVFDVGGVLVDFDWAASLKEGGFTDEEIDRFRREVLSTSLWEELDRSVIPFEEAARAIASHMPEKEAFLYDFVTHMENILTLRPYATSWLESLKKRGYRICILSNFSSVLRDRLLADNGLPFLASADEAVFSCDVHEVKPDKAIFQALIDRTGLDPSRTVFIDDTDRNLRAAAEAGFYTVHFRTYEQAVKELSRLGVRP